jgi:AAA family ATP:ADP antiporter
MATERAYIVSASTSRACEATVCASAPSKPLAGVRGPLNIPSQPPAPPSAFERTLAYVLRPFAEVEPGEGVTAALLTLTVFLLLTAYYLLKTAREPLILLHGGAEVKQYAAAGQALLLVVVVNAYSALARRVGRQTLIATVYLFFASNLIVFAILARANIVIGVPFFLWVGVFNMTAVSQFWSLAADVYTPEQGKRLFAIMGIGSSVGAVAGARVAKSLAPLGPAWLMGVAAVILVACVGLFAWVGARVGSPARKTGETHHDEPLVHEHVARVLARDRYLLLIAGLTLLLNWVRSNGDYLLDRTLLTALVDAKAHGADPSTFVTSFKAEYFEWVNITGVALQLFVVSRVMSRFGVRTALLVLPAVAFLEYGTFLVAPILSIFLVAKVGESSLEYSLQNTARQALFLVCSRVEKYVGKTVVDTVVVRAGDALTAVVVWAGTRAALPTRVFATLNLVLIVVWIAAVLAIGRENARRSGEGEERIAAEPLPS